MAKKITDAQYAKAYNQMFTSVNQSMKNYIKVLRDKNLSKEEKDAFALKEAKEMEANIEKLEKIEREYKSQNEK